MDEIKSCYIFLDIGSEPKVVAKYAFEKPNYFFRYGKSYINDSSAFALDPLHLPFDVANPERITSKRDGFGVLADATPDKWGRNLTLALHKRTPLNQLEWLISAQGNAVGCLSASLSSTKLKTPSNQQIKFGDLQKYMTLAKAIERNIPIDDVGGQSMYVNNMLEKLIHHGSSMGGARPKVVLHHNNSEWIAKLNKSSDLFDNARVEYACMKMAAAIGINTSEVDLQEVTHSPVLLVKRFDRNCPERKKHYISAFSLLNIERVREGDERMSYTQISKVCSQICRDAVQNQKELFTRMILNVMLSNTDDHLKNHGFLMYDMKNQHYALSPAFDILPHGNIGSFPKVHALNIGSEGRIGTLKNILSRCNAFGLNESQARDIIKNVRDVLENKNTFFKDAELNSHQIRLLEPYFNMNLI